MSLTSHTPEGEIVLSLQGISKQYGAVQALRDVNLECRAGEIHAVVGENGSGKSTLLGVASGFVDPDHGTIQIGGQPLRKDSPAKALKLGLNHPMGPFELVDLVGLDTRLSILQYLHGILGEKYRPCPLLVQHVKAGRLGRKVGRGVYDY